MILYQVFCLISGINMIQNYLLCKEDEDKTKAAELSLMFLWCHNLVGLCSLLMPCLPQRSRNHLQVSLKLAIMRSFLPCSLLQAEVITSSCTCKGESGPKRVAGLTSSFLYPVFCGFEEFSAEVLAQLSSTHLLSRVWWWTKPVQEIRKDRQVAFSRVSLLIRQYWKNYCLLYLLYRSEHFPTGETKSSQYLFCKVTRLVWRAAKGSVYQIDCPGSSGENYQRFQWLVSLPV